MTPTQIVREALERIAKRPELPNPERDADWKNCQKWSRHDAQQALSALEGCVLIPVDLLDPDKVWTMFLNDEAADDWDSFQVQLFAPYVGRV